MSRLLVVGCAGAAVLLSVGAGGGAPAQAQATFQLAPAATIGVTDNAAVTSTPGQGAGDIFGGASVDARGRYEAQRSTHTLRYFLGYTHFFVHTGLDTLTNTLAWNSNFALTARLNLGLYAAATFSRTGRVDITDLTAINPQANIEGSSQFLNTMAGESLSYQASGQWRFFQALTAGQLIYLSSTVDLPNTTLVTAQLRAEHQRMRNTIFLDLQGGDSYSPATMTDPVGSLRQGNTYIAQAMLGWRRDLNVVWTSELQGGALALFKADGPFIVAPAAIASLRYIRRPWFASFSLSQTPQSNMFIGEATVNDQALARAALPLKKNETVFLAGYASYIYARASTDLGNFQRAYDQKAAGVSLSYRPLKLPLVASLIYTVVDQNGGTVAGRSTNDLIVQTLALTVAGVFAWGPGTPPLFSGLPPGSGGGMGGLP